MDGSSNKTPSEVIHVKSHSVSCDGGVGTLGHPKVYLKITGTQIMCPYCSRLFVVEPGTTDGGH